MTFAIDALHVLAGLMLTAAALFALYRLALGPTSLDRSIAADAIIAVLIGAVGLYMVTFDTAIALPILVVLSLLGFTAAVGMARLISNRSDQIRTLHELRHRQDAGPSNDVDAWEEDDSDGTPA